MIWFQFFFFTGEMFGSMRRELQPVALRFATVDEWEFILSLVHDRFDAGALYDCFGFLLFGENLVI